MGWGIYCTNNLYFHKPRFNNKYGVTEEIEECDRNIENAKQNLLIMAASEPKNLIEKDCEGRDFSIVESINIDSFENGEFIYNHNKYESYEITLSWDYKKDLGYDKKGKVTIIKIEDKLYVVSYEGGEK